MAGRDEPSAGPGPAGPNELIGRVVEAMSTPGGGAGRFALPTGRLVAATMVGAGLVAALGVLVGPRLRAGAVDASLAAGLAAAAGATAGVLLIRPWRPRSAGEWPFALLAGQGISFLAVLILAAALYFAARPDPAVYAVVAAGGFLSALLAQVAVYGPRLRETDSSSR